MTLLRPYDTNEHVVPGFLPRTPSAPARHFGAYRFGDLLLCLLVSWGLFGQTTLLLLASWLNLDTRGLTMPARALTVLLALLVVISLLVRVHRAYTAWPVAMFLLFWGVYAARLLIDGSHPLTLAPADYPRGLRYITVMALGGCLLPGLAILLSTCWSAHRFTYAGALLLAGAAGAASLSMYGDQLATFSHRMSGGQDVGASTSVHALTLGYTGATLVIFALHALIGIRTGLIRRWIFAGSLGAIGIALLVGSASRGPVIAVATASLVLLASLARRREIVRLTVSVVATAAIAAGLFLYTQATGSTLMDRLLGIAAEVSNDTDQAVRLDLYAEAFDDFVRSPLIGARVFQDDTGYPHNLVLEAMMATGLAGTIPLLLVLAAGLQATWYILVKEPSLGWLPLVFIVYLVAGMFSWAIYNNVSLWLTLAATLSCAAWLRRQEPAG